MLAEVLSLVHRRLRRRRPQRREGAARRAERVKRVCRARVRRRMFSLMAGGARASKGVHTSASELAQNRGELLASCVESGSHSSLREATGTALGHKNRESTRSAKIVDVTH